jgi:hypothetical protein
VVDEKYFYLAILVLQEDRLPVVRVFGTNVDQPRQPEVIEVSNPLECHTRKHIRDT